jgi:AbrB family looped-hinge helix DNA binding protein
MKTVYKVEEIFSDIENDPENVTMTIPPDICEHMGLEPGDTVKITWTDGEIRLEKIKETNE